jgi:uroporphyrinogen-III decarboxylase
MVEVDLDWLQDQDPSAQKTISQLLGRLRNDVLEHLEVTRHSEPDIQDGVARWTDEWGTGWTDDGYGAKPESYPLQDRYDNLQHDTVPDPDLPGRFDAVDRMLQQRGDRYVLAAVWFTLFERLWMLRGFENMLMDPYVHPREFGLLRDRIVDYDLALIDHWLERGVDGIFFSDDWGHQNGLLIQPDDWRRFYKPSYARLFDRVRSAGAHVWMHLCGDITSILPDLVEIGLNVLNPVQPRAMDVNALSRDFGGTLCFYGGVDVQGTLIHGQPHEIRQEINQLVDIFGRFNGGYIGGTSHSVMPETPLENVITMLETFLSLQDRHRRDGTMAG